MIQMKISEIQEACGGKLQGNPDTWIEEITIDSRKAKKGCLFAAIKGERTDGHSYIAAAARQGAAAVLCEKVPENAEIPYILTESTLKALQDIAAYMLKKAALIKVGIGGSVGKTSTKEAVASVLEQKFSVLKTQGNFNNGLGVPLTIFNLKKENNAAVIEMGIDDFGQMHELASIVRPNICLLTNIGDCHLENLGDREGVLKAKSEMFDFLEEKDRIVLNGDDAHLKRLCSLKKGKPLFFGLDSKNDVWADEIESFGLKGSSCCIHCKLGSEKVFVPKPGIFMVYNALAATAVGMLMGLTLDEIKRGIESQESVSGRFNIIQKNDLCIIDDCYNANPMSMKSSLESLSQADGRRVAVLGDMGELGENEEELHRQVGRFAAEDKADLICCIGTLGRFIAEEAKRGKGQVLCFETVEEFEKEIPSLIQKKDTILVKASHFMAFDRIVKTLGETVLDK